MGGGELQLSFIGAQDLQLTSQPQVSFFKSVYKRYSNFSKEIKDLLNDSSSNNLSSFNNDIILNYIIPRNGDCLKSIYLEFDLPDIYSSDIKKFQWIKNLGEFIIKNITITGNDSQEYARLTGEYLHIHNNFNLSSGKKKQLDKLIGNTIDVYNPAGTISAGGIYPHSKKPTGTDSIISIPSINGRKIIIPLPFWFSLNLGNTLPLIALQRTQLKITVVLRPLCEWYTVIDSYPLSNTFLSRIRPIREEDKLINFTPLASNDILNTTVVRARGEFIFLSSEERKKIAVATEHKYLINQVQYVSNSISSVGSSINGSNLTIDIKDINHPVKRLWYFIRRIDNELINDWSNFTFLNEDGLNPLSKNVISDSHHNYQLSYGNSVNVNNNNRINFLKSSKNGDIISKMQLLFNGNPRYDLIPNSYFEPSLDTLTHNENNYEETRGIYCVSFEVKNNGDYQPSGSCNFSRIKDKKILLLINDASNIIKTTGNINESIDNYRFFVIAENINFFTIRSSQAGLEFSN